MAKNNRDNNNDRGNKDNRGNQSNSDKNEDKDSNRGLASADKETRQRVSREGGKASHGGGNR